MKMRFLRPHLQPMPSIKSCTRSFDIICVFKHLNISCMHGEVHKLANTHENTFELDCDLWMNEQLVLSKQSFHAFTRGRE